MSDIGTPCLIGNIKINQPVKSLYKLFNVNIAKGALCVKFSRFDVFEIFLTFLVFF